MLGQGRSIDDSAQEEAERALAAARESHLRAIAESVATIRAFSEALAGDRTVAHRRLQDALRAQADAERAYERARQQANGVSYAGRPRLSRHP